MDSTGASARVIDSLQVALEADFALVRAFLPEFTPPDTVILLLLPGPGLSFIEKGTVLIGQYGDDLDFNYLPHQLTHVWTGYQRRSFFEEGLAVYVTTKLVPAAHPDPYRALSPHEWTSLFAKNGSAIPLETAFGAANFGFTLAGSSADASAWQLFVQAGSFTQWVIEAFGRAAWLRLYKADDFASGLGTDAASLETEWLQAMRAAFPDPTPCEEALAPVGMREQFWCRRANGQ